MDPHIEEIYLREIDIQTGYAVRAVQRINDILREAPWEDLSELFRELTALLQHAASVSRILWPPPWGKKEARERAENRGKYLRRVLGVEDEHHLSDRSFRNHFEHFDERLDDWAETSAGKSLVDIFVGPRGADQAAAPRWRLLSRI